MGRIIGLTFDEPKKAPVKEVSVEEAAPKTEVTAEAEPKKNTRKGK